jgi:outer membrane protein insertion porin family
MHFLKPIGVPHSIFLENLFAKTYDATKLDDDMELVREALQNRGFFKGNVGDPQTKIRDTGHAGFHVFLIRPGPGKAMDITIPIDEGERYKLGGITFKGNKAITNTAALRSLFAIKDGDIFNREKIAKGLENLKNAYGTQGYINFTSVPTPRIDEDKKLVYFDIDVDEGKQFSVRRIEFQGNTTTRDKVIRRELVLEEGQVYNEQYWKLSLQRLNQLGFFEQLKPDDPNVTERHLDEKDGLVDLTLKVKERGKNQIGLSGGVSGLAGSFVGLSYTTKNFAAKYYVWFYRTLLLGSSGHSRFYGLWSKADLRSGAANCASDWSVTGPFTGRTAESAKLHAIQPGIHADRLASPASFI